eukprot:s7057_g2.t1
MHSCSVATETETTVDAKVALLRIAAELRASLDAAKEAADAEAVRASEMEKNLEQQRKELSETLGVL